MSINEQITKIQALWRGYSVRKKLIESQMEVKKSWGKVFSVPDCKRDSKAKATFSNPSFLLKF